MVIKPCLITAEWVKGQRCSESHAIPNEANVFQQLWICLLSTHRQLMHCCNSVCCDIPVKSICFRALLQRLVPRCGFHCNIGVRQDLLSYSSVHFYSSTCQRRYTTEPRSVYVCARKCGFCPTVASHRDLTIMWQSCSTWREMTLLHFYIKSTDRIHF